MDVCQELKDKVVRSSEDVLYRVLDLDPRTGSVKIQRIFDKSMVLLDWKKKQNVKQLGHPQFFEEYEFLKEEEAHKVRSSIFNSKRHHFFIKYFADEGECFPLELRPEGININDYLINFNAHQN